MQGKICLKDNVNINLKMQEKTGHEYNRILDLNKKYLVYPKHKVTQQASCERKEPCCASPTSFSQTSNYDSW